PRRASRSRTAASSASIWVRCSWSMKQWWGGDPPVQGGHEIHARRFETTGRQGGQAFGIALPRNERVEDGPATGAKDVGEHGVELHIRPIQRLLDPEAMPGDLAHELLAGAGEIAQVLDRLGRDEAAADEAMREEIGDPGGIVDVGL